jgi:hypothetical protein
MVLLQSVEHRLVPPPPSPPPSPTSAPKVSANRLPLSSLSVSSLGKRVVGPHPPGFPQVPPNPQRYVRGSLAWQALVLRAADDGASTDLSALLCVRFPSAPPAEARALAECMAASAAAAAAYAQDSA